MLEFDIHNIDHCLRELEREAEKRKASALLLQPEAVGGRAIMAKCKLSRHSTRKRWTCSPVQVVVFSLLIVYNLYNAFESMIDQFHTHLSSTSSAGLPATLFQTCENTLVSPDGAKATDHLRRQPRHFSACEINYSIYRRIDNDTAESSGLTSEERRIYLTNGALANGLRKSSFLFGQVEAIRLTSLEAPTTVSAGQTMRLRCNYETRGDKLQSLSWYKNGREFFRYQPFERSQPILVFNLTGINVDIARSRNSTVYLTNTTSETSGRYKCEITANTFQEVNYETVINVLTVGSGATKIALVGRSTFAFLMTVSMLIFTVY